MRQFLSGAAVASAVLVAAGFAVVKEPAAASVRKTVPLKLSDLTLDRAFRYQFNVGDFAVNPTIIQLPATVGIVITSIRDPNAAYKFRVAINGGLLEDFENSAAPVGHNLAPPLIVPPGGSISVGATNGNPLVQKEVAVAGYFVYPGEV